MTEEWRPVAGFKDSYEVSNLGRVRSKDRVILCAGLPSRRKGVVLYLYHRGSESVTVSLYKRNKLYTKIVARLVAEAFIPNPDKLRVVKHLDGDYKNNAVSNLKWVSAINKKE